MNISEDDFEQGIEDVNQSARIAFHAYLESLTREQLIEFSKRDFESAIFVSDILARLHIAANEIRGNFMGDSNVARMRRIRKILKEHQAWIDAVELPTELDEQAKDISEKAFESVIRRVQERN